MTLSLGRVNTAKEEPCSKTDPAGHQPSIFWSEGVISDKKSFEELPGMSDEAS